MKSPPITLLETVRSDRMSRFVSGAAGEICTVMVFLRNVACRQCIVSRTRVESETGESMLCFKCGVLSSYYIAI